MTYKSCGNVIPCEVIDICLFIYMTHYKGNLKLVNIIFNPLTPNGPYMGRTAPLTTKRCILYIYSTNICIEYFKHALYAPFFLFKMQFVS